MSSGIQHEDTVARLYGEGDIGSEMSRRSAWVEGGVRGGGSVPAMQGFTSASGNWTTCCENCTVMCPTPDPIPEYSDIISNQGVRIAIFILYLIAIIAALLGNACVIVIIHKKKSLRRNPTILLILHLALCDFVSCLLYRPLFLVELFLPFRQTVPQSYDHLDQCKVTGYFQSLFVGVVFFTMVAISQERLLLIVRPLQAKRLCTATRAKRILILIWVITAGIMLPAPILFTEMLVVSIDGTIISFCGYFSGGHGAIVYFTFIFCMYFGMPLIVMSFSYGKIFSALYYRSGALAVNEEAGAKSLRTRRSLARMMMSISILFALCWGPNFIYLLYVSSGGHVAKNGFFIATLVKFLPIISSALNPFLYTINSRTFRNGFRSLLLRRKSFDDPSFGRGSSYTATTSLRRKSSSQSFYSVKRQSSLEGTGASRKTSTQMMSPSRQSSSASYYRPVNVHRVSTLSTRVGDDDDVGVMTPLNEVNENTDKSPRDSGLGPEENSGATEAGTFPRLQPKKKKKSGNFGEISV